MQDAVPTPKTESSIDDEFLSSEVPDTKATTVAPTPVAELDESEKESLVFLFRSCFEYNWKVFQPDCEFDVVLVVDRSQSVDEDYQKELKTAGQVIEIAPKKDYDEGKIRVGVTSFARVR